MKSRARVWQYALAVAAGVTCMFVSDNWSALRQANVVRKRTRLSDVRRHQGASPAWRDEPAVERCVETSTVLAATMPPPTAATITEATKGGPVGR
jgi:hypothetical protein